MMNCETTKDLLIDLAYGELDEVRQAAVHQHLDGCASCQSEWKLLQRGRQAAALVTVAEPPELSAALLAAIEQSMPSSSASASHTTSNANVPPSGKPANSDPDRSGQRSANANARDSVTKLVAVSSAVPGANSHESAGSPEVHDAPKVIELKGNSRWLDRVAALAMRREVAMAAVFVVAVGVGITTLYSPSQHLAVSEDDRARNVVPAVEVNPDQGRSNAAPNNAVVAPRVRGVAVNPNERPAELRRAEPAAPTATNANSVATGSSLANSRSGGAAIAHTLNNAEGERAAGLDDGMQRENGQTQTAAFRQQATAPSNAGAADQAPTTWEQNGAFANRGAPPIQQRQLQGQIAQMPSPVVNTPPAAIPQRIAMSNAGVEVAGVPQEPRSANEIAAQAALSRGDTTTALAQLNQALLAASDDVTRARLRRQIDALNAAATNNAVAAAAQNAAQSANSASATAAGTPQQQVQNQDVSVRRPAMRRVVSPGRGRNQSQPSSVDNYGNLGFKRETR